MAVKRKRRVSPSSQGLAPGEQLKRSALSGNNSSRWGWVGTEVTQTSDISPEHLLISCGLSKQNNHPFCQNKYSEEITTQPVQKNGVLPLDGEDDVIIISDDEGLPCIPRNCKSNPNCLNYLGQDKWENQDGALETFMKAAALEDNPALNTREPNFPVGLKNLGATCYANASLQVWFRDLTFRSGVYQCVAPEDSKSKYKDSPIFQLQVTFAALQESIQNCFNPVKLVESLQLRTTEQQDAQEFSKLFMSHLDAEFKKQANLQVKSLVTDQFQGKIVYGTLCNNCQYRSERVSDFLEIEINLKNNAKLEDRIESLLQPEILSGENQYLCSTCECLQDATRYTELKELPPVLHFSLLRFVYDLSTMERKKSKHSILFPAALDMSPFMGTRGKNDFSKSTACGAVIYELRGVLLHKGSSAYHGHYEAQVFDKAHNSWFQFDDETVTKIKVLGGNSRSKPIVVDDDSDENQKQPSNPRKRRRVTNEVDDSPFDETPAEYISSKDAYMLIYSRKLDSGKSPSTTSIDQILDAPVPPSDALDVVKGLNAAHDEACETYDNKGCLSFTDHHREKMMKAKFHERRRQVMEIYRNWTVDVVNQQDAVLVSRQALSAWLLQHQNSVIATEKSQEQPLGKHIRLDDIICEHGAIDPNKSNDIKRLDRAAYSSIVKDTGWEFEPHFSISDICVECVQRSFQERLYQIEHPRLVSRFERISEVAFGGTGFWISKPWVKDWKLTKPKMHVMSENDPGPDSGDFASDILCEHGALSLNTSSRRSVSTEAVELLQELFPSWNPLSTDAESCPVCDASVHISKENKREVRKQAEEEKAKLKTLHEQLLVEGPGVLEDVPCALIPHAFAKSWRKWLDRPTDYLRPEQIDNNSFTCEHKLLAFDPNVPNELEVAGLVVFKSDWDILETLYPAGPLISITRKGQDNDLPSVYRHDPPVCTDCRMKRKTQWVSTQVFVRLSSTERKKGPGTLGSKKAATYSRSAHRQSRRLRQIKELGEKHRFTISKSTTVKEIKVMIQGGLEIPTICQRLFYCNKELDDNAATMESLGIMADDILDLRRENEIVDLEADSEDDKRPRDEERGFYGTLLGRSDSVNGAPTSSPPADVDQQKSCSACTFLNEGDAASCTICDTLFA